MKIDCHQHFWKVSRGDYHWMTPGPPLLHRDFMPEDLLPILRQLNFDKTIVVQAAQTTAETDFLLDLASRCEFIAGVVGWLDLESPQFAENFARYQSNEKFIGLRPMLQDLPDDSWISRPTVLKSLEIIAHANFPFEFLTHTRHLPHVLQVLEILPTLRGVIDHISKPEIKAQKLEPWKALISKASNCPSLYCKLSGMITEADHNRWKVEDLRPYVEHVVDCFGWDRIMFGSDWPVSMLAGDYGRVYEALHEIVAPSLTAGREAKLFGENAQRFYRL